MMLLAYAIEGKEVVQVSLFYSVNVMVKKAELFCKTKDSIRRSIFGM